LVTNVNPLRIFIFKDGLARFASKKYKFKAFNNSFIHLTNYDIIKDNTNFKVDTSAEGNTGYKRSLEIIFSIGERRNIY
jgi:tubulin polyglutamylase TTLL6/13